MRTDLFLSCPIETVHITKTSNTHLYRGVLVLPGMCNAVEIIPFCVQLIRANAKNSITCILNRKNAIRQGEIHLFISHSRGVPLKCRFCYSPYMIAAFHECFSLEFWKLVTLVKKNHVYSKYDSQFAPGAFPDYEPQLKLKTNIGKLCDMTNFVFHRV